VDRKRARSDDDKAVRRGDILDAARAVLDAGELDAFAMAAVAAKLGLVKGTIYRYFPTRGKVMNVASTAAFMPGPLMAVYYSTKAYVLSFSEAVNNELKGTGVTMTAVCPGPVASGFQSGADMGDSKLVKGKKIMSAETCARLAVRGMNKGKAVVVVGLKNKLLAMSPRFMPRAMVPGMVRRAQAPS
jgi:short-subunit dehydrogenase